MSDLLGKTIGQYQLVEFINRGDTSSIYKAFQPSMDRYVAVKVLSSSLTRDQDFAQAFQREAQLVAQLEHTGILPVYDSGEQDDLLYVVTPYIEGGTLRDRLPQLYSLQDALQILRPIAEALDYAHGQGVVHGNLKPSNILIDQRGQPLLTDFGLARRIGADPSKVYLSPEQAQGQSIDKQTDVYALGVMLYEMLAGEPPQTTAPPSLRLKRPDLPVEVEDVILKAMAQYPEQRYQTAGALCDALEAASRTQEASAAELDEKTIGQYQLVEFINRGDTSIIYKALQPSMDRYVVVKVLSPSLARDQDFAQVFQREAQLVARLEHTSILPVYDSGEEDDLLYVVTPYVEGGTLRDRLPQLYSLQDALQILRPIAEALDYAHGQGVVHGNLKPSNILINQRGQPLLTDFGLARRADDDPSKVYLSPEQAQGQSIDKQTDVYALGVMLYEMLAGELPQTALFPSLRLKRPDLPVEVEDVILKAMAQYPEQRYQTAGALCDALEAVLITQEAPVTEPDEGLPTNVKIGIAVGAALLAIIGCGLLAIFGGKLFGGGSSDIEITDIRGEYYDNPDLQGEPVLVRNDTEINFNWGAGSPAPEVPADNFSVRWSGTVDFEEGTYTIRVHVEGGVRLWLDGALLIDDWTAQGPRTLEADSGHLSAGGHSLEVNYFKSSGNGQIAVRWDKQGVDQPPMAVISGPTEAQVSQSVRFDASGSVVTEGSSIVAWQWDLGDGTQFTDAVVDHTYTVAGAYNVTLIVTDDKGLSDSSTLQIQIGNVPPTLEPEQPPVAIITAPSEGQVGQATTFDASQSQAANPIVSYAWDFGDESTADAISIDHVYNRAGAYNVRLTLTDDKDLQGGTSVQIQITDVVPPTVPPTEPPTEPPTVPSTVPPIQLQGKVAFESNRNGSPDIYLLDTADFSVSRLTSDPAVDTQPAWSPDGSQFAFVTNRDGNYEIYVAKTDLTSMINLTNDPADDLYPAWSPDGEWIVFTTDRDGNQEIYAVRADGSEGHNLTNNPAQDYKPSWFVIAQHLLSTDERIAFVSDRDGNDEIYSMEPDGSAPHNVTNHPANDFYPTGSPDGKQIVFTSDRDGNQEVYVMGINGMNPVNLTNDPAEDLYPIWSPDGRWIAFTTNRDGNQEIYCMNTDGSNLFNLTNNAATDLFPTWIE